MRISTHVLDTARGVPARDMAVKLERQERAGEWRLIGSGRTDANGRCDQLLSDGETLAAGAYRVEFETGAYHAAQNVQALFPLVQVTFVVRDGEKHFHIPLLLSPYGYTTYRGS